MSRAPTGLSGLAPVPALGITFAGVSRAMVSSFPDVPGFTTVMLASAGTFASMTGGKPHEPPVTP